jgi:hypothetical protein
MRTCVAILNRHVWVDVAFRLFWMENLTKVLSSSFLIALVPSVIKKKAQ